MATVGWVGLGKLGAPCAAALAQHGGHTVYGYDVAPREVDDPVWEGLRPVPYVDSVGDVVDRTDDVVYVAVQTPHARAYGGETFTPSEPRDFEYGYLVQAVRDVAAAARERQKYITLVIVSTVLPGTFDRELRSLLNPFVRPVYHPFFIAMGTVVDDFVQPEMTLFGVDTEGDEEPVRKLYQSLHAAPAPVMSIPSAELTKVAYNTFISAKIVFANTLAQLSDATGANVDDVTEALARGYDRIISDRYLTAGMGDGGACHPRDNVALSALAQWTGSVDLMGFLTQAREDHTRWLARLVQSWHELARLPVMLLGESYKPGVGLVDGSPALLLLAALEELGVTASSVDPHVNRSDSRYLHEQALAGPHVYVVSTRHEEFAGLRYPAGSVVIDPFGYVLPTAGVTLVTPGRR